MLLLSSSRCSVTAILDLEDDVDCGGDEVEENCNVDAPDLYNTNDGALLFGFLVEVVAVVGGDDDDDDGGVVVGSKDEG